MRIIITLIMIISLWACNISARIWYIRNDGTGDAPTIQAAVDSAIAGDTILVGPGTYSYALPIIIEEKDSISVLSAKGPQETFVNSIGVYFGNGTHIAGFTFENDEFGIVIEWSHNFIIENNIVRNTGNAGILGAVVSQSQIRSNIVYACHGDGIWVGDAAGSIAISNNTIFWCAYGGIYTDADPILFENNIICFNDIGITSINPYYSIFSCNDVYGNSTNYELLGMGDPTGTNGNISVDPQFCGAKPDSSGNFFLQSDSPCAPGNHPSGYPCSLIGREPVNCGSTGAEQTTWGRIRSLYR